LTLFGGLLLTALAGVDIVHHRLPDAITLPAFPAAAMVVGLTYLGWPSSGSVLRAVVCAALCWSIFTALAWMNSAWMGRGDVKLIPTLALLMGYLSWPALVFGLGLAFLLGALVSAIGVAIGRLKLRSAIPLGPYLLLGCWVVLLVRP